MIADAHLHLPWDVDGLPQKKQALLDELRRNRVTCGVVIADSAAESTIGSSAECVRLFSGCENIRTVAGISPLIDFDAQLKRCEAWLQNGEIAGMKLFTGHEDFACTDAVCLPVYDLAAKFGAPVLFHTGWENHSCAEPSKMKKLASARPQNTFVYCHCFYPDVRTCFETLADCPNVLFDASSLADDPAVAEIIAPELQRAIEAMPDRVIFGSDFASCSEAAHLAFAKSLKISDAARRMFLFENACRVYRFALQQRVSPSADGDQRRCLWTLQAF